MPLGTDRLGSTNSAKRSTEATFGAPKLTLGFVDRDNHVVSIATTEWLGKSADALSRSGDAVSDRREFGSSAFEGFGHPSRLPTGHTVPGTV